MSSPRPWGCFRYSDVVHHEARVFPTPVGVFPRASSAAAWAPSLPHARGGVSLRTQDIPCLSGSSPRPWGCFPEEDRTYQCGPVFPTPVGVFLGYPPTHSRIRRLPHARGGVSPDMAIRHGRNTSSPRPWGCFCQQISALARRHVFPTPVGVFPTSRSATSCAGGLPHARGGVSRQNPWPLTRAESSPRPWGCFLRLDLPRLSSLVFPTPVGVFLRHQQDH